MIKKVKELLESIGFYVSISNSDNELTASKSVYSEDREVGLHYAVNYWEQGEENKFLLFTNSLKLEEDPEFGVIYLENGDTDVLYNGRFEAFNIDKISLDDYSK